MRWPWQRARAEEVPGPVYRRPRSGWVGLPPIQRTVSGQPLVNAVPRFTADLAAWRNPSLLALPMPEAPSRGDDQVRAHRTGDQLPPPFFSIAHGSSPVERIAQRAVDSPAPLVGLGQPLPQAVAPIVAAPHRPTVPTRTRGPAPATNPMPTPADPAPTTVVPTVPPVIPAAAPGAPTTVLRAAIPDPIESPASLSSAVAPGAPVTALRAATVSPPVARSQPVSRPPDSPRTEPPVNRPLVTLPPTAAKATAPPASPPLVPQPMAPPPPVARPPAPPLSVPQPMASPLSAAQPLAASAAVAQPPILPAPIAQGANSRPPANPTPVSRLAVAQPPMTVRSAVPPPQPPPPVWPAAPTVSTITVPASNALATAAEPRLDSPLPTFLPPTVQRTVTEDRRDPAYPAVLAQEFAAAPPPPAASLPVAVTLQEPASVPPPAPRAVQLSPASHGVPPRSPRSPEPLAGGWRHPDPGRYAVPEDTAMANGNPAPDAGGTIWTNVASQPGSALTAVQRQVIQREADPVVDAVPTVEEPAAPATVTSSPPPPAAEPPATPAPEELLKSLYDPLLRRLKAELRRDRERRSSVTDPPIRPI